MSISSGLTSGPQSGLRSGFNPTSGALPLSIVSVVGDTATIAFTGVTTTTDWINVVFPADAADGVTGTWVYANSGTQVPGGVVVASGQVAISGLSAGATYQARIMFNNTSTVVARLTFQT